MHFFSYTIFILINAPVALQFTARKKLWGNLPKFECPKAGLGVILTTFSNNHESVGGGVYLKRGVY